MALIALSALPAWFRLRRVGKICATSQAFKIISLQDCTHLLVEHLHRVHRSFDSLRATEACLRLASPVTEAKLAL
jgi:hypothetical protein